MAYKVKVIGIYKITNLINGKIYIGESINCYERISKHKSKLRKGIHDNCHLQNSWNLYGENNFLFEVIEKCDKTDLLKREHFWCKELLSHNREYGFNIKPTSEINKHLVSKETIEKIRISNTGKKVSEETKKKLSEINIGNTLSKDTIEKLKNSKKNIKIDQYDRNGNFISSYKSIREAERQTGIMSKCITKSLKVEFNIVGGYIFKYNGELITNEEIENRNKNSHIQMRIPVVGHTLDGKLVGEFASYYEAAKFTNQDPWKISLCCRGKQKRVKNIIWSHLLNKT